MESEELLRQLQNAAAEVAAEQEAESSSGIRQLPTIPVDPFKKAVFREVLGVARFLEPAPEYIRYKTLSDGIMVVDYVGCRTVPAIYFDHSKVRVKGLTPAEQAEKAKAGTGFYCIRDWDAAEEFVLATFSLPQGGEIAVFHSAPEGRVTEQAS